ncbi:MAG TPA: hypothetical protein VFP84_31900 [Kofleriaceae bacterium]|nr:hypothetical protein [Kofleriaceae bacterium]
MTQYAGKQSIAPTSPTSTAGPAGPAPGKSTLVQQVQLSSAGGGGEAAGPTPLARVQAAASANDLPGLVAIQVELVGQLQQQASSPGKDLRDGVAFARTWTMDQIAAIRDRFAPQVTAASATTAQGDDNAKAVEAIEAQEDQACTPYLEALLKGDPQYRYLHFNPEVQDKVFAAVRLHSARRGLAQEGHRAAAEQEARSLGGLPKGSWCGVFAYAQAAKGGGMDPHWAAQMQGEGGIRSALTYAGTQNIWVWAFDHWESLKQYHQSRGSLRYYEVLGAGLPSKPVQPGDIALLDRDFGLDPDHIITVAAFDGRFLYTIGGNQGTDSPDDEKGVSTSGPFDLARQPAPNDVTEWTTNADGEKVKGHKKGVAKHVRIHGIGRWSIVDYETHVYMTSDKMPTAQPSAAALGNAQKPM